MKTKTKKKNSLNKSASLIEHFMRTLERISVSLYISKALYSFSYKNLSIFKAKLNKYLCPSFPEKKIHSRTHHMNICSNFPVKQRRMAQTNLPTGHKQVFSQLSFVVLSVVAPSWRATTYIGVVLMSAYHKVSLDVVLVKNCYVNFLIF